MSIRRWLEGLYSLCSDIYEEINDDVNMKHSFNTLPDDSVNTNEIFLSTFPHDIYTVFDQLTSDDLRNRAKKRLILRDATAVG